MTRPVLPEVAVAAGGLYVRISPDSSYTLT